MSDHPQELSDEARAFLDRMASARVVNTRAIEVISRARASLKELRDLCTPEQLPGRYCNRPFVNESATRMLRQLRSLEKEINPE